MIKLLALDAATEVCSVAIDTGDQRWSRYSDTPKSHAHMLLPFIDQLLNESQQPLHGLDAIALTHGPGSFTGIRIAMSVAQGLSYACGLPLIPVSSLDALVYDFCFLSHKHKLKNGDFVIAALDARMNEVYWAIYQLIDGSLKPLNQPSKSSVDEFQHHWRALISTQSAAIEDIDIGSTFAIGHGWAIPLLFEQAVAEGVSSHADVFPSAAGIVEYIRAKEECRKTSPSFAQDVAIADIPVNDSTVTSKIIAQLGCDASSIEPLYLRNEITWKKRERIRPVNEM